MHSTFLRFTEDAWGDLRRNSSLFKTPLMPEAEILPGLCGFLFDIENLTDEEIESQVRMYARNFSYYADGRDAVIYEGSYIERNRNEEGVVFRASGINRIIYL